MRCPWGSQRRITVDRRVLSELLPPNIDLIAANRNVRFTSLCDVQYAVPAVTDRVTIINPVRYSRSIHPKPPVCIRPI
jgi:hypothetical protein